MSSSEEATLLRIREGNLEEFDVLYTRYVGPIYGYLYRRTLVRALAEDLTSTTFLRALERIESYDAARGTFSSWLYAIARNALTDHFRSSHPTKEIDDVWDLASEERMPDESFDAHAMTADVRAALSKLDQRQRQIVMLRLWEDLSYKEIAQMLSLTETNAKVIFHRAIETLKKDVPLSSLLLLALSPRFL